MLIVYFHSGSTLNYYKIIAYTLDLNNYDFKLSLYYLSNAYTSGFLSSTRIVIKLVRVCCSCLFLYIRAFSKGK